MATIHSMSNARCRILSTTIKVNFDQYSFSAKGREVVFDGYTKVIDSKDEGDQILPVLKEGDTLDLDSINLIQKYTKPPARFSESAC